MMAHIWFLTYYYVKWPILRLDEERWSTLDSRASLMLTKCLQNVCTILF